MKLLLDTHILVWLATVRDKLTGKEWDAILGAEAIHVSALSIWEIRLKWKNSTVKAATQGLVTPEAVLLFVAASPITLADLTAADCAARIEPQLSHRDPFDEMLLVHAQRLGARLLTRDEKLRGHPLAYLA